jgi:ribonuclease J
MVSAGPEIHARGHAWEDSDFDSIRQPIIDAVNAVIADGATDTYAMQQAVRRTIGRWLGTTLRRRPMIIPVVIEA